MMPILQIGPLALPLPALLLIAGFWIGLDLTEKQAGWFGVKAGPLYNAVLVGLIAGLVGARLVYAAYSPQAFLASPLSLFTPRPQMLDTTGGVLVGLVAALMYIRIQRLPLWPTLDAATTLFAVMAVTLGLAHFASGDAFGAPSQVPWAIYLWGEMRQPSQVYETLAALAIAAVVWPGGLLIRRAVVRRMAGSRSGLRFWLFLALSAAARLVLESFRGDSIILWNTFREAQVIAWLVLGISLWQIGRRINAPVEEVETPGLDSVA